MRMSAPHAPDFNLKCWPLSRTVTNAVRCLASRCSGATLGAPVAACNPTTRHYPLQEETGLINAVASRHVLVSLISLARSTPWLYRPTAYNALPYNQTVYVHRTAMLSLYVRHTRTPLPQTILCFRSVRIGTAPLFSHWPYAVRSTIPRTFSTDQPLSRSLFVYIYLGGAGRDSQLETKFVNHS